ESLIVSIAINGTSTCLCRRDGYWIPDRHPCRADAGRAGRKLAQSHSNRATDLQDDEADLRVAFLKDWFELSQGGARRIPGTGNVVAGVSLPATRWGCGEEIAARRARVGVHALHAQPDHRILLLRKAKRPYRTRYYCRKCDDVADFGRHGSAGQ